MKTAEEIYASSSKQQVIGREDAIIMAKKYHAQFGWREVKNELPESQVKVLIHVEAENLSFDSLGYLYSGDWKNMDGEIIYGSITHWMPIPKL